MSKSIIYNSLIVTGCVMTLMASGGGESMEPESPPPAQEPAATTPTPTPTPSVPSYETLDSRADVTSTIGGIVARTNNTTGLVSFVNLSGTLKHDTGATTLSDGTISVTDPDGGDDNGVLSDGTNSLVVGSSGSYDYVTTVRSSYIEGGTSFDTSGFAGVVTSAEDMPSTGGATYTGESQGVLVTATQGFDLNDGSSTVTADFASGTVDVELSGFTVTDQVTGNAAVAPIDTVKVTGMTISGNGFAGGTFATTNAGADVNVTGANTSSQTAGTFFGYDTATKTPDEVAGVTGSRGDDALLGAAFIAD